MGIRWSSRDSLGFGVGGLVIGLSLLAASCGTPMDSASRFGGGVDGPGYAGLAGLASARPGAGFTAGGGGLAGGVWTVPGMPGAGGPGDAGVPVSAMQVSQVGGVRVRLTALTDGDGVGQAAAGKAKDVPSKKGNGLVPARFVVRSTEAGSVDTAPVLFDSRDGAGCVVAGSRVACDVPAGVLRVGGAYFVDSSVGEVTARRIFSVVDEAAVSGSNAVGFAGRQVQTGGGDFGVGVSFNTADQGVTVDTAAVSGVRGGLPVGWSWSGLPDDAGFVSVVDVGGWQGYAKVLILDSGGAAESLGCVASASGSGFTCSSLTGSAVGVGRSATVSGDGSQVIVTDSSASSSWIYDGSGRPVRYVELGSSPLSLEYGDSARSAPISKLSFGALTWEVFYLGDRRCDDTAPGGFLSPSPAGLVCGWANPTGEWVRVFYTDAGGGPMLARVVVAPTACQWKVDGCDWRSLQVNDIGWDDHRRPFAVRDGQHSLAVMAGALKADPDPGQDSSLLATTYEQADDGVGHQLGRIETQTSPATGPGLARVSGKMTYNEYDQVDPRWAPATRTVSAVAAPVDGSIPATKGVKAFDDATRPIWQQGSDQTVTGYVWHPVKNLQLATVGKDNVSGSVYDLFGRATDQYFGPAVAFDPAGCTPNGVKRGDDSCKPVDMAGVSSTHTEYDQQDHTGKGLTQIWFNSPDFSGQPAGIKVGSFNQAGMVLAIPAGTGSRWSVRMAGGLLLPTDKLEIDLSVSDPDVSGTLWVNGMPCQIPSGGQTAQCPYDNTDPTFATSSALPLRLDLARDGNSGSAESVTVTANLQNLDQGSSDALTDEMLTQRVMTPTSITSIDQAPAANNNPKTRKGKSGGKGGIRSVGSLVTATTDMYFGQVFSPDPDRVVSTVQNGTGPVVTEPAVTTTFDLSSTGSSRVTRQETVNGTYTTAYWGNSQTPTQAGVANLDQIKEAGLADQPQYGLPRSVTDSTGRTTNLIYDKYGQAACDSLGADGEWGCSLVDDMSRPIATTSRGDDGLIRTDYTYQLGDSVDPTFALVATTKTDGQPDQTQITKTTYGGVLVEYTDSVGTRTSYQNDAIGRTAVTTITPAASPNGPPLKPLKTVNTRDQLGRLTQVTINNVEAAKLAYATTDDRATGARSGMPTAVTYPDRGVSTAYHYTHGAVDSQTWTLADGGKITDSVQTSTLGRLYSAQFAGASLNYNYDAGMRLTGAHLGGVDYTYGYDDGPNRTCAAPATPNPENTPCDSLPAHHTYTYANDKPATHINPAGVTTNYTYSSDGNLATDGTYQLAYNSYKLLATAVGSDNTKLSRTYDSQGRTTSETTTRPAPAPTTQPAPTDTGPTTTTIRYGFSDGSSSKPVLAYTDAGPVFSYSLPGGLYVDGSVAGIESNNGQGHLTLKPDGTRGDNQPVLAGPYGERPGSDPNLSNRFIGMGARTYNQTDGFFLQPDPSIFPGGPQHAYTPADPINYSDPTGTSPTWNSQSTGQKVLNGLIRILVPLVIVALAIGFAMWAHTKKNWRYRYAAAGAVLSVAWVGASLLGDSCNTSGCGTTNAPNWAKAVQYMGALVLVVATALALGRAGMEHAADRYEAAESRLRVANSEREASLGAAADRRQIAAGKAGKLAGNNKLTVIPEEAGNGLFSIEPGGGNNLKGAMENPSFGPTLEKDQQVASLRGPGMLSEQQIEEQSFIEINDSEIPEEMLRGKIGNPDIFTFGFDGEKSK